MKLGEKIKAERIRLGLTQNAIAGDFITRNMLSCIESGKVQPSIETLKYLSETLNLPIGYLMDEEENLFFLVCFRVYPLQKSRIQYAKIYFAYFRNKRKFLGFLPMESYRELALCYSRQIRAQTRFYDCPYPFYKANGISVFPTNATAFLLSSNIMESASCASS